MAHRDPSTLPDTTDPQLAILTVKHQRQVQENHKGQESKDTDKHDDTTRGVVLVLVVVVP